MVMKVRELIEQLLKQPPENDAHVQNLTQYNADSDGIVEVVNIDRVGTITIIEGEDPLAPEIPES